MKEFLKEILVHNSKFKQVKISSLTIKSIQEIAVELLNLKDLNQLRDKYEGAAFLKRLSKEIMSFVAIERILEIKLLNWELRKKTKDYPFEIEINDRKIGINIFEFGEYPVLIDETENRPMIFCYLKGQDTIVVCGYASIDVILNNKKEISNSTFVAGQKVQFTGFKDLKSINSVDDLY